MKKLLIIVCSAVALSIGSTAAAQEQNTSTGLREDAERTENRVEQNEATEQQTEQTTGEEQESADKVRNERAGQDAPATDQELEQATDNMEEAWKSSTVNAKVGPNGEKLFMERGKYYYYNDEGKKVKVKKSALRDNPEN